MARNLPWLGTSELLFLRRSRFPAIASLILRTTIRTFIRFVSRFSSGVCFVIVWYLCRLLWWNQMAGAWPPAFPPLRTAFVLTLLTTTIWGILMVSFYPLRSVCILLWTRLWGRFRHRWMYDSMHIINMARTAGADLGEEPRAIDDLASGHFRRIRRHVGWAVAYTGYLSVAILGVYMLCTYEQPLDHRFKSAVDLANNHPKREGYWTGGKIFIAAMFHDNADVLPYWTNEITKLIHFLGPDNVFISILESYSSDNSPVILDNFDRRLKQMNVARRILTRDTSLVRPVSMKTALPRIQFLAASRNKVLEPLVKHGGFERVIFSNDIFVEAESIVELLHTKDGNYDMACGLDLSYWGLFDQWVIRDRLGRLASTLWPYFLEDTGFRAVMADEPAPVFTCWNGIVSIRADPFLPPPMRIGQLSTSPLTRPIPPTHPAYPSPANLTPAATPPLRFRPSGKYECFSSECFNLPYDLRRRFDLQDIYVNPRVITSYVWAHYLWFKYVTRHWAVKWWIEKVENGNGIHLAKLILGDPARVWQWDGGECHPG